MNASPAPVVSTASTAYGITVRTPDSSAYSAPFAPSVTITRGTPEASNLSAARRASSMLFTAIPVNASASVSLGIT